MIKVRNFKETLLATLPDGRRKVALDVNLAPVQFSENDIEWQDIDTNQAEADPEFTFRFSQLPYVVRIAENGKLRFYPDRTDQTSYIEFPKVHNLIDKLIRNGNVFSFDGLHIGIVITFGTSCVDIQYIVKDNDAPRELTIPFNLVGLIQEGRFYYKDGEVKAGWHRPILYDTAGNIGKVYICMELGRVILTGEPTGLTYPATLHLRLGMRING